MTTQEWASETVQWFTTRERGEDTIVTVKDGAPDYVTDMCHEAHGDMFPDDWRYAAIRAAVEHIADNGADEDASHDFADGYVDTYNTERSAWLASNLTRAGYVDEARDEGLIGPDADTFAQLGIGQYMEAREVFESVLRFLEERADEDE